MKRLLLAFGLSAALVGCGRESTPVAPPAAPAAETAAPEAPATAPTAGELDQAATATQETSDTAATAPGDASLERIVAMPDPVPLPGRWRSGTHFLPIAPAQATNTEPGEVEVLEFLWLGCDTCRRAQPYAEAWKRNKPAYVKFTQEHVMWSPAHRGHGRLLYTLQALGRDDLVAKAFDEIHGPRRNVLVANSDAETQRMQVAFARANGISEADFLREYNSFGVNTRLQRADELGRRYRIEAVPTFIVNGKYRTDLGMTGTFETLLELLADLSASERGR